MKYIRFEKDYSKWETMMIIVRNGNNFCNISPFTLQLHLVLVRVGVFWGICR